MVELVEALVEVVGLVEEGKHSLVVEVFVEVLVEARQYSNSMSPFLNLDTLFLLIELLF